MARSRNIKPGFFRNEDLVELPFETRLLFIGLWTVADREGRLEDRPKRIKIELFPADNLDIDDCLQQLHDAGFIHRYIVGGARYIQVLAFKKHQNPHKHEQASTIPAPDEIDSADTESDASTGHAPDMHHASPADSLNTDSLNTDSPKQRPDAAGRSARFDRFWSAYPKKRSKGAAEKAWAKINPSDDLTDKIIAAIDAHKKTLDWQKEGGQFIPYPASWLNAKGWEDEVGTSLRLVNASPFAGAGFDPLRSMPKDEHDAYLRELEESKRRTAEIERQLEEDRKRGMAS